MIKLVILDVDGTLTDGKIYIDNMGNEMKAFNVKDGFAISECVKKGIIFSIITGRTSKIVEKRASELRIQEVIQGSHDKVEDLKNILNKYNINFEETLYIGDDLNDYEAMKLCGYRACPNDAVSKIRGLANYVANYDGGNGAVRDILDHLIF